VLSERARHYLASDRVTSTGTTYARAHAGDLEPALRSIDAYAGLRFDVPGGLLQGTLEFAAQDPLSLIWRTADGRLAFLAADHSDAQCAFLISETGAFGSSWTDEFGHLFDSADDLIESLALWDQVRGWIYVSIFDGTPEDVLPAIADLTPDPVSAWWSSPTTAVIVEPYLTPTVHDGPQTTILARDPDTAHHLTTLLATNPHFAAGRTAAHLHGRVGLDAG
jgi:hypothetical protein